MLENKNGNEKNMQNQLKQQIAEKNKTIEKLQRIINWYRKNTGINPDVDFDEDENDKNFTNNVINSNEAHLQQKIMNLKEKISTLTEKKNYYKSKVNISIKFNNLVSSC